jgi:hypothetical protein
MIARMDRKIAKFGAPRSQPYAVESSCNSSSSALATDEPPCDDEPSCDEPSDETPCQIELCKLVYECSTESVQFSSFNPCTTFDHPSTKPSDTNFPSLPLPSGPSIRHVALVINTPHHDITSTRFVDRILFS